MHTKDKVNAEVTVPLASDNQGNRTDWMRSETYPVRYLRQRYPISRAMAEIVANEFGWGSA